VCELEVLPAAISTEQNLHGPDLAVLIAHDGQAQQQQQAARVESFFWRLFDGIRRKRGSLAWAARYLAWRHWQWQCGAALLQHHNNKMAHIGH
jgi:hypothetical protein